MATADRTSRKRSATRDRIARIAAALFERHGYEAVTMEQIAAQADVARGTLYNHFPVKEAVLAHWMHAQLASDLTPLLHEILARPAFATRVTALLEASARWWEAHRQYAAPYLRYRFQQVDGQADGQAASEMIVVYAQLIEHAQRRGEVRSDATPERLAHYLHYLYLCALVTWLGGKDASLAEEFTQAVDFFLRGAVAPATREVVR